MGLKPKAIARVGNRFILVPFPSLLGSATAPPEIPSGPPSASWTLDFSSGEPWANGTNYVFSSTASTSRTFVNSSGYVAPCVANLVLQSQDFSTTWTNNLTTESLSGTAPDGSATSWRIQESIGNGGHNIVSGWHSKAATTITYTISCYVKKDSTDPCDYAAVTGQAFNENTYGVVVDLSNGSVTDTYSSGTPNGSHSVTNVGSGWYRVSLTMTSTTATLLRVLIGTHRTATATWSVSGPTYTILSGSTLLNCLAWGAQIVVGSDPLPYSKTTTAANGIPRLTHNSSGSRLGLLVEGQRTNLCIESEVLSDSSRWGTNGISTAANQVAAPDNQVTAERLTETNAGITVVHRLQAQLQTVSASTTYTASMYLKKDTLDHAGVSLLYNDSATTVYTVIINLTNGAFETTLSNGTPTNTGYKIENVGNGWYRLSVTHTSPAGTTGARITATGWRTGATSSVGYPSYLVSVGDEKAFYAWGGQIEAGVDSSSYIRTTFPAVTRQADIAYVETADVTNWGRPGSFVVEYYPPQAQSGTIVVADDDGVGSVGRLGVEYSSGGPRIIYGTASTGTGGTPTAGLQKIGWAWDASGAATRSALNGSALDTSLATSFDPTLTDGINLGGNIDWTSLPLTVSGQPNVVIRRVRFWNSQLSAADLNTLTT